nr:HAD family hydrolase [uncultured Flavobacterium sp.]
MGIKAIILDLDNTIYPAFSIGDKLFGELYFLLEINQSEFEGTMENIKIDINRKPFSVVAKEYKMSKSLYSDAVQLLKGLTYNEPIAYFEDYNAVRNIDCDKFLVTSGFPNLQHSKIKQLNIEKDFKGISIVDTISTDNTKKDVFEGIQMNHNYKLSEILVVGDDLHSEIAAAQALGMKSVLYSKDFEKQFDNLDVPVVHSFESLSSFL